MRTIKLNNRILVATFCVLVSMIIPVTALAVDCPCFTEKDVMRYASHPAKFVCNWIDSQGVMRLLVRGPYTAYFSISGDDWPQVECQAKVTIGNPAEPKVVFLNSHLPSGVMTEEEYSECRTLIWIGDPPECEFD